MGSSDLAQVQAILEYVGITIANGSFSSMKIVMNGCEVLRRGLKWEIGHGESVKFFKDLWIGASPLRCGLMWWCQMELMRMSLLKSLLPLIDDRIEQGWRKLLVVKCPRLLAKCHCLIEIIVTN